MIIDCHTHWGSVWEARDGGDAQAWLAVLDSHRVDKAILFGDRSLVRSDLCQKENDIIARLADKHPERLVAMGTSWPQMKERGVTEARRCFESLNMKGIKFHPWLQGFSTADPYLDEICELAGELGKPIFFHDGTPCYSLSEQIAGLARRHRRTRFVLAHTGLVWNWRAAMSAMRLPNVWGCLCGPHLRAIELICAHCDPSRIIWGSDFGFGLSDAIEYRLNLFLAASVKSELRERVLDANPLRLLRGA